MSEYIHNSHNVTLLLYHLVFLAKYSKAVFGYISGSRIKGSMFRYIKEVPDKVFRNRHRYRSCTLFGTIHSNLERNKDNKNNKKHYGTANTKAMSTSEVTVVGRGILDGWVFYWYCGQAWR